MVREFCLPLRTALKKDQSSNPIVPNQLIQIFFMAFIPIGIGRYMDQLMQRVARDRAGPPAPKVRRLTTR